MKLFRFLFFIFITVAVSTSCFASKNATGSKNGNKTRNIPLDLFYGMTFDKERGAYVDSVLDSIQGLNHYEYDKVWFQNNGDDYNFWYHAQLGLYIDSVIPHKIWANLQPILNENFTEHISYDMPFDSLYRNDIWETVDTPLSYAEKWENLMNKFTETMKPKLEVSKYEEILPLRACGVVHKVFENENWATYLVEFSFWYHGGCGCPSYADYISFNKKDGHQLTETEILADYDKNLMEDQLYKELAKAKIARGQNPDGGASMHTKKLLGASGIAYIEDGILIYFQPYVAGCGAEGQYNIILESKNIK